MGQVKRLVGSGTYLDLLLSGAAFIWICFDLGLLLSGSAFTWIYSLPQANKENHEKLTVIGYKIYCNLLKNIIRFFDILTVSLHLI
jgi:hypothetical protein